jgi:transcriptional regulator GlxA family with amidase domain
MIEEYVEPYLDATTARLFRLATEGVRDLMTVDRLAEAAGVSRRTLVNWLSTAGRLKPNEIVLWSRLFVAADLPRESKEPVDKIAAMAGFSSAVSLRKSLSKHAGMTASKLRRQGIEGLLRSFRARLRSAAQLHSGSQP